MNEVATSPEAGPGRGRALADMAGAQWLQSSAVLLTIVLISAYTALNSSAFLTTDNLLNILSQMSVMGIVAIGMSILMISGGIDLSIGSLVSLTGVIAGSWLADEASFWLVLPATIAIGALFGAATGAVVAKSRVQPFVITLGGLSLFQGLALLSSGGEQVSLFTGGAFAELGVGTVLGIPICGLVLVGVLILAHVGMTYTRIGRNLYSIGGNETAAYLAGINVDRYKIGVYALLGGLGGLAAMITASKIAGALPLMGQGLELQAIAAAVIGGVALTGGRGTVIGGMLGVVLLGVIQNSLNLLSIQDDYQTLIVGIIIIVAVVASKSQREARA